MFHFKKFRTMKKIDNNFTVTGFVGKDTKTRQFSTASVARFSLANTIFSSYFRKYLYL